MTSFDLFRHILITLIEWLSGKTIPQKWCNSYAAHIYKTSVSTDNNMNKLMCYLRPICISAAHPVFLYQQPSNLHQIRSYLPAGWNTLQKSIFAQFRRLDLSGWQQHQRMNICIDGALKAEKWLFTLSLSFTRRALQAEICHSRRFLKRVGHFGPKFKVDEMSLAKTLLS